MSAEIAQTEPRWRPFRFAGYVAIIFLLQIAIIYWLADPHTPAPRLPRYVPPITLMDSVDPELLALENPALFALPSPEGFSGEAWMRNPTVEHPPFDWNEAPRWLPLQLEPLGNVLAAVAPDRSAYRLDTAPITPPALNDPSLSPIRLLPDRSTLTVLSVQEDLLAAPVPELPAWGHSDLLGETVVQVLVRADGKLASATVLSGSGFKPADDYALNLARSLAYRSNPGGVEALTTPGSLRWARLVFQWHTVPSASTGQTPSAS